MANVMQKIQSFLNLVPHWVILVLSGATGSLLTYFQQQSTADLVHSFTSLTLLKPILAGGVTVFVAALVNLLKAAPWANWAPSPSVPTKTVGGKLPPTLPVIVLACLLGPMGAVVYATGCASGSSIAPIVQPVADLTAKIIADALKGMTVAQIIEDTGSDVLTIFQALLGSRDPSVQKTPAFGEAMTTKLGLARIDAGAP